MRGLVKVTEMTDEYDRKHFTAACTRCRWSYSNVVKSDVELHKRWHRCPEVSP